MKYALRLATPFGGSGMKKSFCLFFALFFLPVFPASSALILKIKGRKALVDLEGVQAKKGDTFSALNLYGKALGLLQIKKIKRGKAIALLLKGKMGPNWILEPSAQDSSRFLASVEDGVVEEERMRRSEIYSSPRRSRFVEKANSSSGFGFIAGPHLNRVQLNPNQPAVSGISFQGVFMLDFSFMDGVIAEPGVRVLLGYQQLRLKNSGQRPGLVLHYPAGGALARVVFLKNSMFQPWLGGGGFLFWPFVDKTRDLGLDKRSFKSFHGALTGAVGLDFHFKGFYVPVQVDMNWINPVLISLQAVQPNSKEFKPYYFGVKVGLAFPF